MLYLHLALLAVASFVLPTAFGLPSPRSMPTKGSTRSFVGSSPDERYEPIHWLTHFGSSIPADTVVDLEWTGGSGKGYEVYYIPQWVGQEDYFPQDIVTTTEMHYQWRTPKSSAYPEGTTFIVGVLDLDSPDFSSEWYDLTGLLAFGN